MLRAIALEVAGLVVKPQVQIRYDDFAARVDLADDDLRIVLEADSHEFHTSRKDFDRDCRRYNGLVVRDWIVLRFTWEQVMFEPAVVRRMIEAAVTLRRSPRAVETPLGPTGRSDRSEAALSAPERQSFRPLDPEAVCRPAQKVSRGT